MVTKRRAFVRYATPSADGNASPLSFAEDIAMRMLRDDSRWAVRPINTTAFLELVRGVFDTSNDPLGSQRQMDSNMRLWGRYCQHMGTPAWRPDAGALSPNDKMREIVLSAGFIPWALTRMRGRRGNSRAKPSSAYSAYLGVRRSHSQHGIMMVDAKLVRTTLKRMCRRHIKDFGARSLIPKRKEPFTYAMITALCGVKGDLPEVKNGTMLGRTCIKWNSQHGRALRCALVLGARTGMRKSEITLDAGQSFDGTCASRANLSWSLRGKLYITPPLGLLRAPQRGDYAILVPPLSKADQFGEVWGSSPIYLSWQADEPLCAFDALAAIELHDPVNGAARELIPLISPDGAQPFRGTVLATLLAQMIAIVVGKERAKLYSFHSMRIFLACSLLASKATAPQIMALCRWQTEESLAIYARLNPDSYTSLLERSLRADVGSVSTANLPTLSGENTLRELFMAADEELSDAKVTAAAKKHAHWVHKAFRQSCEASIGPRVVSLPGKAVKPA
jgi:hypothetical protein